ncbi:MAG: cellulose synthase/poly-beta-1,6-N-acetylglucosamine synthase-like glycosyltransferase [Patiriisocius sp.]|jgi:cellulose synthase/poly-beta-1,6-N-acetylglucosamine synthase-like glycosyltransferase
MHTYMIYPGLLKLLSGDRKINSAGFTHDQLPFVSIIIAAYNEELVIEDKLRSILNSEYDHKKMEILVGSDGSKDMTDMLVRELQKQFPIIQFHRFDRSGKTGVLNQLTPLAKSDIVVYTDANVIFEKSNLAQLVSRFKDEEIGLVGANIMSEDHKNKGISFQEEKYIERENMIKFREGILWGAMMGAFGGCYAMRKSLFKVIPTNFIVDDFYLSLNVLMQDRKAILDLEAICYEEVSVKESEEFRRKVRMSSGNFQNLFHFLPLIWKLPISHGFAFISHKILRWLTPLLIIMIFIASYILLDVHWIYKLAFYSQLTFMLFPLLNTVIIKLNIRSKIIQFISYFYSMNLALLIGMVKYFSGVNSAIWEPTERKPGESDSD